MGLYGPSTAPGLMRALPLSLLLALAAAASAQVPGGTYTLGASGADFGSFQEAFAVLENDGISGPVVIEVQPGTYAERAALGFVDGASATNTITFTGVPSGTTLPTIRETPTSGEPYLIQIQKSPYVSLDHLRFEVANPNQSRGRLLLIESDHVTVEFCEFQSIDDASITASTDAVVDVYGFDVAIIDSEIDEGDIGVRYNEAFNGSPASGGRVHRNSFDRNATAGLYVTDQAVSSGNAISIRDNTVYQGNVDQLGWVGLWVDGITGGAVLARNYVVPKSGTGIRVEQVDNATTAWTSVVNNAVRGDVFRYEGNAEGIQILDAQRVRVLNNTVHIESISVEERNGGTALFIDGASSSVRVVNNILVHDGHGLNLEIESTGAITDVDFQVFEAPTAPDLMRVSVNGVPFTKMSAYRAATGDSQNAIAWSVEFGPQLRLAGRSDGDGQLIGQPEPGAPSDIDGDTRDATYPYRGADEAATPLAPPPPLLSGDYTVGSGGDFASIAAAFEAIDAQGLGGAVDFQVLDGTYSGSSTFPNTLDVGPFPGSSSVRTVTFRSLTGNATLELDAWNFNFNWVLRLTNVQHLTFKNITFRSLDPDYADVIWVRGGNDITFDGCTFTTAAPTAIGTLMEIGGAIQSGPERNPRDIRVLNSTFVGGRRAVDIIVIDAGGGFRDEGGFEVAGNRVYGLHPTFDGIAMSARASGVIRGNTVSSPSSGPDFIGIEVGGNSTGIPQSDVIVEANEVTAGDGVGILWDGYGAPLPNEPQVVYRLINNTVRMNGTGPSVGLQIEGPDALVAAHNTVSNGSTNPGSAAAYVDIPYLNTSIDLRNNVFDAKGGLALGLSVPRIDSRYVYDDNAFWTDGANLALYEVFTSPPVFCSDLACIQAASQSGSSGGNQDLNSVVMEVAFVDAEGGDLRLHPSMGGDPDMAGAGLPEVPTDLDGTLRSTDRPYRGAHELPESLSFVVFDTRVYLQGAYEWTCGFGCAALSTGLQDAGLLPLANPYADPSFDGTPVEHDGTESFTQAEIDAMDPIVDWIVVALRESPSGPDVYRGAHLLDQFGRVRGSDGSPTLQVPLPAGDYHVVVFHRNHLPVMSNPVSLNEGPAAPVQFWRSTTVYGWPDGVARVYVEPSGSWSHSGMASGDGDLDGSVLAPDQQGVWLPGVGQTGYLQADYNLDGTILADDQQAYWLPNVGIQSAVPGTSSLAPETPRRTATRPTPDARSAPAPPAARAGRTPPEARRRE